MTTEDPLLRMKEAVIALGLELPTEVWHDVRERFNALAAHVTELREAAGVGRG